MPARPFERLKAIFSGAMDLEEAARSAYLDEACAGDAEMRAQAEALLAQHAAGRGLLGDDDESEWAMPGPQQTRELRDGDLLAGRFRVLRYVGRGGMGEVYEAEDLELSGRVALKTLRREVLIDSRNVSRFKREIQLARRVTHPNVCRVFDVGRHLREDGAEVAFLTMEFLEGETLAQYLKREGPMAPEEALPVIREVTEGLRALHDANIVHRDLKPGNVMLVTSSLRATRAVITDFGLARAHEIGASTAASSSGLFAGTPAYMSPEQLVGDPLGPYSDIYSLGIVSYEVLTGSLPFQGKSAINLMLRKLTEEPLPPSAIEAGLAGPWDELVMICLEKDVSRRPQSPQQVLRMLDGLQETALEAEARTTVRVSGVRQLAGLSAASSDRRRLDAGGRGRPRKLWWIAASAAGLALAAATTAAVGNPSAARRLCRIFPGSATVCALPADKDVAILPWTVEAQGEEGKIVAEGLADYLNGAFYRLYPNKDSMCVHIRHDQMSEGVNLRMEGAIRANAGSLTVSFQLKDARDPKHLTLRTFERTVSLGDDQALYLGLPEDLMDAFELRQDVEKSMSKVWEAWAQQGPGNAAPEEFRVYLAALGRIKRGQFQDAAFELGSIVPRDPQFTLAYVALGDAYRSLAARAPAGSEAQKGWFDSARNAYDRAAKNDVFGGFPMARSGLGDLAILQGEPRAAIEAYNEALDVDPYDYSILHGLTKAYESVEELPQVEAVWLRALGLRRQCWLVRNSVGFYYARHGQPEKALEHLQEFARQEPNHHVAHNNLAYQYLEMGRVDDAIEAAARAIELNPAPMGYSALGRAYLYRGCADDAVVNLRQAAELADAVGSAPDDLYRAVIVWRALAEALESVPGNETATRSAFEAVVARADRLLTIKPEHVGAREDRAAALARLPGHLAESVGEARALIGQFPMNQSAWLTLAVGEEIGGRRRAAFEALEGALERGASIHDVRNIGALAALRREPEYAALDRRLRADPNYRGGNLNFSDAKCPAWDQPGGGLRQPAPKRSASTAK